MKQQSIFFLLFFLLMTLAVSAAPVTIDSSPHTSVDRHRKNMVAFTSDLVGYVFYADSSENVCYKKTTDGGATWDSKVTLVSSADSLGPIIWYDKWTPGDSGNKIHILYIGETNDDLYYIEFNTATDTASTEEVISGAHTSATYDDDNRYYITKSNTGVLYVAAIDDTTSGTFAAKCSSSCTDSSNWADTGTFPFADHDDEDILMMPLDNGDLIAINWDNSGNNIYASKYNSTPNTWTTQALLNSSAADNASYRSCWGAMVNPSNFLVHFATCNDPYANDNDILRYEYYNDTWTQNGNIANHNAQVSSVAVALNATNGDIFVGFLDENAGSNYQITLNEYDSVTDGGISNALATTGTADRSMSINLINNERIYGVWFDDTNDDLEGMTLKDLTAPLYITGFSPVDNGYLAGITSNLSIMFNRAVDIQTGNITIKKTSNDSILETISVAGSQLFGNGTTTIVIDPVRNFAVGGEYYVEIDSGTFVDSDANSYAGFTDNGTWNFAVSDWYNGDWLYRIKITTNGDEIAGTVSNMPLYFDLSDLNGTAGFFENTKSDGADIRVTKSDGTTELAREIVTFSATTNAGEMHFVANGSLYALDTDFYIYYGYNGATAYANGDTYGSDNVWIQDYSGVWHFEEEVSNAAGEVLDSTSGAKPGTSSGMATDDDITAKLGKGLDFDGSDDKVVMSTFTSPATTITTSMWYKPSAVNGTQDVILHGSSSADNYIRMEMNTSKQKTYFSDGVAWSSQVAGTTTLVAGTWYYGAGTGTASTINTYLNGSLENSSSTSRTPGASAGIVVGAWYTGTSYNFPGVIDEVRISSVVRSATWITTEYNNQSNPDGFWNIGSQEEQERRKHLFFSP